MVQEMMQNKGNPMPMLKSLLGGKSPEQINKFFDTAKQMGISEIDIQQVRDGINLKG